MNRDPLHSLSLIGTGSGEQGRGRRKLICVRPGPAAEAKRRRGWLSCSPSLGPVRNAHSSIQLAMEFSDDEAITPSHPGLRFLFKTSTPRSAPAREAKPRRAGSGLRHHRSEVEVGCSLSGLPSGSARNTNFPSILPMEFRADAGCLHGPAQLNNSLLDCVAGLHLDHLQPPDPFGRLPELCWSPCEGRKGAVMHRNDPLGL